MTKEEEKKVWKDTSGDLGTRRHLKKGTKMRLTLRVETWMIFSFKILLFCIIPNVYNE